MSVADVIVQAPGWRDAVRDPEKLVARCHEAVFSIIKTESAAPVAYLLADDAYLRELNKKFRQKDQATNVLSFPSGLSAPANLGDVAIALETVLSEAQATNISVSDHLAHLAVHGLLHVLGFDHELDQQADEMETMEVRALRAIGINSPYRERALMGSDN